MVFSETRFPLCAARPYGSGSCSRAWSGKVWSGFRKDHAQTM